MAYKYYVSIVEISIRGLSDHSRIAIDQYLDQSQPESVILNEILKSIAENTFINYMTLGKISTHSTSGVAILIRNGSSFARMEALKRKFSGMNGQT